MTYILDYEYNSNIRIIKLATRS